MKSRNSHHSRGEARIKAFLARPSHPKGTLSLGELRGFLFALNAAPELVKPSEWIPFIFSDEEPEFRDMEEAEEVMGALMHLYNDINKTVRAKRPMLPPGCVFLDPPMANLEPEAPVSQWARGFSAGHMWLEDAWDRYLPEEMEEEMGAALAALSFFASRSMAEQMAAEFSGADVSIERLAEMFRRVFSEAVMEYAGMGRAIYEAVLEVEERPQNSKSASAPVGRNDPCPCGSGKKSKKCCGAGGGWN
jgi:uncharacterized protein